MRTLHQRCRVNGREEAVVVTDDGSTIVCWHPEPEIPYEMTMVCDAAIILGICMVCTLLACYFILFELNVLIYV